MGQALLCLAQAPPVVLQKEAFVWWNDCFVCGKHPMSWPKHFLMSCKKASLSEMSTPLSGTSILLLPGHMIGSV